PLIPPGAGPFDPPAATTFIPPPGAPAPAGAADPTAVLPHTGGPGAADPTAVMPPMPQGQPGGPGPEDPHPWQNQLRAARDRNEQTQVQYLDPNQDPLRRRPQRQVARPQQPQQRPQQPQQRPPRGQQGGYGHPQQHQPQQYAPQRQPQQPQRYAPPPTPEPQRPQREPRQPRQRSANPMRIPGLGCLKGCLFTIVILFVAGWLIWELSPLQEWIGTGKSYWGQLSDWFSTVTGWIGDLGSNTGSGTN
ncbi:serine/threonine protein kinase, partial [Streptomyces chartreusis]